MAATAGNGQCRQSSQFTQRANISGRNEMAMLGTALNNMSAELAESYADY
ncbi:HAMP domain-containing protein [Escherichia coli]